MRRWCSVVAAALISAGCGGGGDDAALDALENRVAALEDQIDELSSTSSVVTSTSAPSTTAAPTSAPPLITAPPSPDQDIDLAEATFVSLVNDHCDLTMVPDPNFARATVGGEGRFLIVDLDGVALVLDINDRVVYSTEGPDGVLPRNYSFGCDPAVFLGTSDH